MSYLSRTPSGWTHSDHARQIDTELFMAERHERVIPAAAFSSPPPPPVPKPTREEELRQADEFWEYLRQRWEERQEKYGH